MQVAVIGSGIVGVCTAYSLAKAGHEVVVIERQSNVAEQASFGNAGIIAPANAVPWAAPGMPRKILSYLFNANSTVKFRPGLNRALWRWMRSWLAECDVDRYRINKERMQRVAFYSQEILSQLRQQYQLQYERTQGYLQLFRREREMQSAAAAIALLGESGIAHRVLDPEGVRAIEPGLSAAASIAGGLYMPDDEAGNCPLFAKHMRYIAQAIGVEFRFNSTLTALHPDGNRIGLRIGDTLFHADAVVLAGGVDSTSLLAAVGIRIPLCAVRGYSATAHIKDFDAAPLASLMDESCQTSITRLGTRIRVAGIMELGATNASLRAAALRTLIQTGEDWFPQAANYHKATLWSGARPMLPDGAPLLGATPVPNLYINIGHGSDGWAMAAGSGKILADIVSGRAPDINMEGLTLSRYGFIR